MYGTRRPASSWERDRQEHLIVGDTSCERGLMMLSKTWRCSGILVQVQEFETGDRTASLQNAVRDHAWNEKQNQQRQRHATFAQEGFGGLDMWTPWVGTLCNNPRNSRERIEIDNQGHLDTGDETEKENLEELKTEFELIKTILRDNDEVTQVDVTRSSLCCQLCLVSYVTKCTLLRKVSLCMHSLS